MVEADTTGTYLVGTDGFSLYVFDNDEPGVSNCAGECADAWPPFTTDALTVVGAEGVTGTFATITRDDGSEQITYNDAPLYYYVGDEAIGDTNGDGLNEVWHLANVTD